jgi:hypothetical protein
MIYYDTTLYVSALTRKGFIDHILHKHPNSNIVDTDKIDPEDLPMPVRTARARQYMAWLQDTLKEVSGGLGEEKWQRFNEAAELLCELGGASDCRTE